MLDATIKAQLKAYLERLQRPIELVASLDDSAKGQELHGLLTDIAGLSDKVALRTDGQHTLRPSFGVAEPGEAPRIHFAGIPMGHEFTSLVLALLQTGGHPPKIEPALAESPITASSLRTPAASACNASSANSLRPTPMPRALSAT